MTDRELLESISNQIGELVRHVAVIRQSTANLEARMDALETRMASLETRMDRLETRMDTLEARMDGLETEILGIREDVGSMRLDIQALDTKIDTKTDFLSSKIDHFIEHLSAEQTRHRNKLEEERHLNSARHRETEQRLADIERRLERLETSQLTSL